MKRYRIGKKTKRWLYPALAAGTASGIAAAIVSRVSLASAVKSLADNFDRILS